jgi:Tol biopolymer transport system component/DNA-binding winged helix-turn-helix (wHTH) protein
MLGPNSKERLRFGPFELSGATGELLKEGVLLKLQPQPFQVLRLLVSRPGELVTRGEIQEALWPNGTTVEFSQGMNFCIRQIRATLNDDAREPIFIETLPKRGYRFIAPVEAVPSGETVPEQTEATLQSADPKPRTGWMWRWAVASAASILLVAVVGAILGRGRSSKVGALPQVSKVTTYPGDEREPSLSPDGNQVAFSWKGEKSGGRSIYAVQIGGQTPMQITHHNSIESAEDGFPAWSPDGSRIVFLRRYDVNHADIIVVPAMGGPEWKVQAIGAMTESPYPLLTWTPDSKHILFTGMIIEGSSFRYTLNLFSLETGQIKPFLLAGGGAPGDASPAFSPDGQWLVFSRYSEIAKARLMVQKLGAGFEPQDEPIAVPGAIGRPKSPSWSPDSKRVVFTLGGQILEWAMGGTTRVVDATGPTELLSTVWQRDGHVRSVTTRSSSNSDLWRWDLNPVTHKPSGEAVRVAPSTANEVLPRFSPDGRRLAFTSDRTNAKEVWIADARGENLRQLSHLNAYLANFARWSSDNKQVAFHARLPNEGEAWIYIAKVDEGEPRRLAPGITPSFSLDGKYLYGDAPTGGRIIRIRIADGHEEQLFDGDLPVETTDGKRLLYAKTDGSCVYARSLEGDPAKNPEECIADDYTRARGGGFVPVDGGFYYVSYTPEGKPRGFKFYDDVQHRATDIAPVTRFQVGGGWSWSVSRDQRQFAYEASDASSGFDLVLIEFR